MIGSCGTVPVKYSGGARRVGREPARWISMELSPFCQRIGGGCVEACRVTCRPQPEPYAAIDGGLASLSPPYTSLFLAGRVAGLGFGVHRIEAGQCRAVVHLVDDPGFHSLLLRSLGQHMVEARLPDQKRG